ncbi:uncharacterized protein NESG_00746 [Nematocida ausubeli]|uniref:Uncharacterized protein n=1 Tax=Nematocida ausubeli (strain ATCC PRA-371 / ERTm2) TaxID=1913371 RepID=A0A086J377_NEMA1|nr:uncharacterized protein NESG_00746 [Nematocida ausubeli]KFG26595.1 hypothetical protein NESG_00746 [Nematocida ausubeli]
MLIRAGRDAREVVASIIETYAKERNMSLTRENKERLLQHLLPYMKQSLNIPSTLEIKELSRNLLSEEKHSRIEALLMNSTAEIRKAIYFLFKIKQMGIILSDIPIDPEIVAFSGVKNASIGIYMSWFKEISDGNAARVKRQIGVGLFDICFTVYNAGKEYLHLREMCFKDGSPLVKSFLLVVSMHLDAYRESVYAEEVDSLFAFYIRHNKKMKWVHRLGHLVQEIMLHDEHGSLGTVQFVEKLRESPWTEFLADEVLEKYKKPLSDEVVKWLEGYSIANSFIVENDTKEIWQSFVLLEKEIPVSLSIKTAKQILYIGKTKRILPMLRAQSELCLANIPRDGIFNKEWIGSVYALSQERIKKELFLEYKAYEHLRIIRDVFFLFRSDFAYSLVGLLDHLEECPVDAVSVDEILDGCFGQEAAEFVDVMVQGNELSLVYKETFPYSIIVGNISEILLSGFELFWNLRRVIYSVCKMYKNSRTPATFALACRAGEIEYYYFEKVVHALWSFKDLPEEILYNPEKISKKIEDMLCHLISTCKETCTLSILHKIQEVLLQPVTSHNIHIIDNLLQRITSE